MVVEWKAAKCTCGSEKTIDVFLDFKFIVGPGRKPDKPKLSHGRAPSWICTDCGRVWVDVTYREMIIEKLKKQGVE